MQNSTASVLALLRPTGQLVSTLIYPVAHNLRIQPRTLPVVASLRACCLETDALVRCKKIRDNIPTLTELIEEATVTAESGRVMQALAKKESDDVYVSGGTLVSKAWTRSAFEMIIE
jgi:hypothetical protein